MPIILTYFYEDERSTLTVLSQLIKLNGYQVRQTLLLCPFVSFFCTTFNSILSIFICLIVEQIFENQGAKFFNSLSREIQNSENTSLFGKGLEKFLLSWSFILFVEVHTFRFRFLSFSLLLLRENNAFFIQ